MKYADRKYLSCYAPMQKIIQNQFFQSFQIHFHTPQPLSLAPLVQGMGVCPSTFCMWFITTDITVYVIMSYVI